MNLNTTIRNNFIRQNSGPGVKLWRNNIILMNALVVLIFVAPLLNNLGRFMTQSALILVVISGIFAAEYRKHVFNLLLSLGFLVITTMTLAFIFPANRVLNIIPYILAICSLIFSTIALVAHVSQAETVQKSTVLCAINSYLLIGLTASVLFLLVDFMVPSSLPIIEYKPGSLSQYIYFGFVTLSTLGYGDITPAAPLARSMSIFVAIGGQLYLVIVMALIIGKYLNSKNRE